MLKLEKHEQQVSKLNEDSAIFYLLFIINLTSVEKVDINKWKSCEGERVRVIIHKEPDCSL